MKVTVALFLINLEVRAEHIQFSWCSGYHIRLTRGRSPVQSRAIIFRHTRLATALQGQLILNATDEVHEQSGAVVSVLGS